MRIDADHLRFKALAAVLEAADNCRAEPIEPDLSLRFALAYLYAVGTGDRHWFDEFWNVLRDPMGWATNDSIRHSMRPTYARAAFCGIARSVGVEATVEVEQALREQQKKRLCPSRSKPQSSD